MSGFRRAAAVTATILLLGGCSWAGWMSGDDDGATSAPPSSTTSTPEIPAVAGVVRDAEGVPVGGVSVTLTSAETPGHPVPEIAVLTDESGRYRWPPVVEEGRYEVSVTTEQGGASALVAVRPSATASADLTLG